MRLAAPAVAFSDVYRRYFGFVWSGLLRLGVPRSAVEDAVQDVFMVVHRRLPGFEGRGAGLRSWLFTIVRRVAYRHRRRAIRADRKRRALAQVQPRSVALDEALDQRVAVDVLLEALDQLDDDKRAALDLHVFEGLNGPEIARMLEINVDTVYSRIKAARRRLQRSLSARGLDGDPERLVEAVRRSTRPPRNASRKVAAALALQLQRGAATTAAVAATTSSGSLGVKAVVAGLLLAGAATVAVRDGRPAPSSVPSSAEAVVVGHAGSQPRSPGAPAQASSASASPADDPSLGPAPEPNPALAPAPDEPRVARSQEQVATDPSMPSEDELAAEVELLTRAKRALAHDPARTLRLLAAHARRFPRGQLLTERAGYRAIALCQLGQQAQGRGEARLFLAAHAGESLAGRVAEACGLSRPEP